MPKLNEIESFLAAQIFPDLEEGRPNWDKPHTQAVVQKLKEILSHTPNLKFDEKDEVVLVIAAYAHDWGYSGLFKNGQKLNLSDVANMKEAHAVIGVQKLKKLLENPIFNDLTVEQKERACHLVEVHDVVGELTDVDELVLMEADTLSGLDVTMVKPSFDEASNTKYMHGVLDVRIPLFITEYGKKEAERLFMQRVEYYKKKQVEVL